MAAPTVEPMTQVNDLRVLATSLASERAVERVGAADALAALGTTEALDVLFAGLSYPDSAFRIEVVRLLARRPDPFVVARLGRALEDADPYVRIEALSALALVGSERALEVLGGAVADSSPAIRRRAVEALAKAGERGAGALSRALGDSNPGVVRVAVRALAACADASAWRLAALRAGTGGDDLARTVADRLLALEDPGAIASAIRVAEPELGDRLAGKLGLETCVLLSKEGVEAARRRLAAAPPAEREAAFRGLLLGSEAAAREAAVRVLLDLEGPPAVLDLATGPARSIATRVLVEAGTFEGALALAWDLADPDLELRIAALETAIDLGAPDLPSILDRAIDDPSSRVRRRAVESLASADEAAGEALRRAAFDADLEVAARAAGALAGRGCEDPALLPAYASALSAAFVPPGVRAAMARMLGRPGEASVIPSLAAAALDESPLVRRAAAEALVRVGGSESVDALARLANSDDLAIVATAAFALDQAADPRALVPLLRLAEEGRGASSRLAREKAQADPRTKDVTFLLGLLEHARPSVLKAAAQFLTGSSDPRLVDPILAAYDRAAPTVQFVLLGALARFARLEARVAERLIAAIDEGDLSVRQEAIRILGEESIREAVGRLSASLANLFLRPAATEALRRIGDRRGLLAVQRRKLRDQEIVRQMERIAASQRRGPVAVPEHPIVRRARRRRAR